MHFLLTYFGLEVVFALVLWGACILPYDMWILSDSFESLLVGTQSLGTRGLLKGTLQIGL